MKAALDAGDKAALPPNVPPGILGEPGFDVRKTDGDRHGLNAGLSQELDGPVVLMLVLLTYVVFFPLSFWILWRTPTLPRFTKVTLSVIMAFGIVIVAGYLFGWWHAPVR